jgi:hypothetical protein
LRHSFALLAWRERALLLGELDSVKVTFGFNTRDHAISASFLLGMVPSLRYLQWRRNLGHHPICNLIGYRADVDNRHTIKQTHCKVRWERCGKNTQTTGRRHEMMMMLLMENERQRNDNAKIKDGFSDCLQNLLLYLLNLYQ